jgi:hypothetical protein
MMRRVFLSYSRHDEQKAAGLARDLRATGTWVFSYREEPQMAGAAWQERIEAALVGSDAVVIIASGAYLASDNCSLELAMMRRRATNGQLTVLAWSADGSTIDDGLPVRHVFDRASLVQAASG